MNISVILIACVGILILVFGLAQWRNSCPTCPACPAKTTRQCATNPLGICLLECDNVTDKCYSNCDPHDLECVKACYENKMACYQACLSMVA